MRHFRRALAALLIGACAPACVHRAGLRSDLRMRSRRRSEAAISFSPTSRRRPCRSTVSRPFPPPAITGRPATGPGTITTITGSPASGSSRRSRDCCGRRASGLSPAASTPLTPAIGVRMSGYYGGINYGFGYNGLGYQGGRWDSGRFFYNTAVNNIGAATSPMFTPRPSSTTRPINNTSFNGGPGGVVAKPTNEELLAAKEPRVKATPAANRSGARGRHEKRAVRVHEPRQASDRRDRAGRRIQGQGRGAGKGRGKAAEVTPRAARKCCDRRQRAKAGRSTETTGADVAEVEKPSAVEKAVNPNAPRRPRRSRRRLKKPSKPEAAQSSRRSLSRKR